MVKEAAAGYKWRRIRGVTGRWEQLLLCACRKYFELYGRSWQWLVVEAGLRGGKIWQAERNNLMPAAGTETGSFVQLQTAYPSCSQAVAEARSVQQDNSVAKAHTSDQQQLDGILRLGRSKSGLHHLIQIKSAIQLCAIPLALH